MIDVAAQLRALQRCCATVVLRLRGLPPLRMAVCGGRVCGRGQGM